MIGTTNPDLSGALLERDRALGEAVGQWADRLVSAAKSNASSAVSTDQALSRSIKKKLLKKQNQVEGIRVVFVREAAFVHYGAGRGYAGLKGRDFYSTSQGKRLPIRPLSKGRAGTGLRPAKAWLEPVLQEMLPQLETLVKEHLSEGTLRAFSFGGTIRL